MKTVRLSTFVLTCAVYVSTLAYTNDFLLSNRAFFFLKKEYSPLFEKFLDKPDDRELIISSNVYYNNILNDKIDHNTACIENALGGVKLSYQQPKSGYEMFYAHTRNYLKLYTQNSAGITRSRQKLSISGMDMWFRSDHVFGGFILSTNAHDNYSINQIQGKPPLERAFKNPTIDYGFSLGLTHEHLHFMYEVSKNVSLATILSFLLSTDGSSKTAPFSVHALKNNIKIGAALSNHVLEAGIAFRNISSDTILESSQSFQTETDMYHYECTLKDTYADKVILELMIQGLSGDIKAYDNPENNFFYVKDILLNRVLCNVTYKVNKTLVLQAFNEFSKGNYDKATLNFSPFSSWPLVLPLAHEWYNFSCLYDEAGMALSKTFTLGKYHALNFGISTSYVYGNLETQRKDQEIEASVPMFVNDKTITLTSFKGISMIGAVRHQFEFNRFSITTSVNQLVPFWLKKRNKGGTVYSCSLSYNII